MSKVLIKVGKSSKIKLRNVQMIRAITIDELIKVSEEIEDIGAVVIEDIQNNEKEKTEKFISATKLNVVLFSDAINKIDRPMGVSTAREIMQLQLAIKELTGVDTLTFKNIENNTKPSIEKEDTLGELGILGKDIFEGLDDDISISLDNAEDTEETNIESTLIDESNGVELEMVKSERDMYKGLLNKAKEEYESHKESMKEQVLEIEKKTIELKEKLEVANESNRELVDKYNYIKENNVALASDLSSQGVEYEILNSRVDGLLGQIADYERQTENYETQIKNIEEQLGKKDVTNAEAEKKIASLTESLNQEKYARENILKAYKIMSEEAGRVTEELNEAKIEVYNKDVKINELTGECNRLQKSVDKYREEKAKLEDKVENIQGGIDRAETETEEELKTKRLRY